MKRIIIENVEIEYNLCDEYYINTIFTDNGRKAEDAITNVIKNVYK